MYMGQTSSAQNPALKPACLFFTLLPLYYFSWQYTTLKHTKNAEVIVEKPTYSPVWSEAWVDEWLDTHLIAPFNPWPLREYCNKTVWHENLVFNLDNANGGIGNIRGNTLDFILYAIEAGASIMLPGRASRDPANYANVWGGRADFDTFFDEEWFLSAMSQACPQMQIFKPQPDQTMVDPLPEKFFPRSRRVDGGGVNKSTYVQDVTEWLNKQEGYEQDQVVVVNLERSLWEFDTRSLPPGVRRTVGQLLRITPKARRLAARAIQQLAMSSFVVIDPTVAIPPRAFFGAHLRTEADAVQAGWLNAPNTNFSSQTDAYIKQATHHKLSTMYVASGNATDLQLFKEKAALQKINITSKHDLLIDEQDLEELAALSWDQQALIDYEILLRCSVFGGFVRSSFSYNIALTRNQWLDDQGRVSDPWLVRHSEGVIAFDDGLSRIIGRDQLHDSKIPRGMWP